MSSDKLLKQGFPFPTADEKKTETMKGIIAISMNNLVRIKYLVPV